jgi:hypothetical protein
MKRWCAVVLIAVVVLAVAGVVAHSRNPEWMSLSTRTTRLAAADGAGNYLLFTCYDYEDRLTSNKALTEAYEKGERPVIEGRHPATKNTGAFIYSTASRKITPVASDLFRLSLPDSDELLFVRTASLGDTKVLIADPGSGTPWLERSPDGKGYVTWLGNQLYFVDTGSLSVKSLTPDVVGPYCLTDLLNRASLSGTEVSVLWAGYPVWGADSSKVLYVSNRKHLTEGGPGCEIWRVETPTGDNQLVCQLPPAYPLGVYHGLVVLTNGISVKSLDLATGTIGTIVEDGRVLGFGSGLLCTAADYLASSEATITSLSTSQQKTIIAPEQRTFTRFLPDPFGSMIASVVRDSEGNHSVALYGYPDGSLLGEYALPQRYEAVTGMFFLGKDSLLVNLWKTERQRVVEASYVLHLEGGQ